MIIITSNISIFNVVVVVVVVRVVVAVVVLATLKNHISDYD